MAQRTFSVDAGSLLKRVRTLYPIVSVGAAGAVTLQYNKFTAMGAGSVAPTYAVANAPTSGVGYAQSDGEGVRGITRNSAGDWTFTLSDSYQYLIGVAFLGVFNTGGTNANAINGLAVNTTTTSVTTNTAIGNGGLVRVVLMSGSTATDPASGDVIHLKIILGDASEP